jgi:general secretion pathway protein N
MRWIAFGVVFVVTVIALAPATLIDAHFQQASDSRLRLADASGTLWSGTGWIELRDADGRAGLAKRLAWRVLPESLLRGRLVAELTLDGKPFRIASSLSRVEILDAAIHLPAAALGVGVPRLAPFGLTGELVVGIPRLSLEQGRIEGDATVQWRAAGSTLTPVSPLGAYEVQLKAVGADVHAALRTLEGPLQLDGKGSWSSGAAPKFLATARVPAQHQEQLAPLLRLVALERGAGVFELHGR